MSNSVDSATFRLANELEDLARRLRQGQWRAAYSRMLTSSEDVAAALTAIKGDHDGTPRLVEPSPGPSRDLFVLVVQQEATERDHPSAPSKDRSASQRLSPAQQRLADALGTDKAETLAFMRDVWRLAPTTKLADITRAVQQHQTRENAPPTPEQIAARLPRPPENQPAASPRPASPVARSIDEPEKKVKKERTHVSVWEIRK
ncbi:hypothetical protein [Deinococcus yavapaiensis]|uniref:Uncharacterized protein n=1 Tax=Deinococcus yavapaiensis KR-236 TaxID=694435 RepID=A0A318S2H5_9DEIO|nr:hypothetical protein [Deinococcus yavapaiensis]PYE52037.1 hypothetical protein DES52_11383 [Deinococcus yavapaiensis KR-236]